ncbi:hypothetical protein FRC08_017674 [Ceratobasidium sp. 394]|nr:hypothetical protein FRC08_017674 [Ceratobasidium sp. 394]
MPDDCVFFVLVCSFPKGEWSLTACCSGLIALVRQVRLQIHSGFASSGRLGIAIVPFAATTQLKPPITVGLFASSCTANLIGITEHLKIATGLSEITTKLGRMLTVINPTASEGFNCTIKSSVFQNYVVKL